MPIKRSRKSSRDYVVDGLSALHIPDFRIRFVRKDMILMCHSIEAHCSGYEYGVTLNHFEEQLTFLMRKFLIVSLDQLFSRPYAGRARVALTFDDAYLDFYTNVYPLLKKHRVQATVFVPTAFIGNSLELMERDGFTASKPHLTWGQIKEMHASGLVAFGSHTHKHIDSVAHIKELQADVETSIEILEKQLGERPRYFAYPHGFHNEATNKILLKYKFERLLSTESDYVQDQYVEGRFDINAKNATMPYFKLTVAGLTATRIKRKLGLPTYRPYG